MTDWTVIKKNRRVSAAFLLSALTLSGCSSQAKQQADSQAPPAPTVEVVTVAPQDTPIFSEYPAQTYARDLVEVRAKVDGYIEKWLFKPGQQVSAGQPLYTLDLRPYRAQLQQAQGLVKQAEADLTFAKQQVSIVEAEANLESARSNLVKAQQDYDRLKPLVEQDAAARQDLDAATAALRAAEAFVRARQATLQQARLTTETQVKAAEGRLQQQKGSLNTASLNVEYGTVRSPISGRVGDTLTPVGGLVTANAPQPLTTVTPLDPVWVRFKVSETQYLEYERLKRSANGQGPPVELFLADGSKLPHPGHIENTLNQVDPRTGTLEVQARFPNPEKTVLPGQFGRVRLQTKAREDVILVPQRAVQQNQTVQVVYAVTPGNKIDARPVKTAERVGNDWIVEQGLRPGDRVVVEGVLSVRPGIPVKPVPYKASESK
jgi:membrane fusion protein (multidrug efflux system)